MKNAYTLPMILVFSVLATTGIIAQDNFHRFYITGYNSAADVVAGPVIQMMDGGFVTVAFLDDSNGGHGGYLLLKTDADGNEEWARRYTGKPSQDGKNGFDLAATPEGGFVFAATLNEKGFILKYNSAGEIIWNRSLFSGSGGDLRVHKLEIDPSGVITVLCSNSDLALLRINADGGLQLLQRELNTDMEDVLIPIDFTMLSTGEYYLLCDLSVDNKQVLIRLNQFLIPVWSQLINYPGLRFSQIIKEVDDNIILAGMHSPSATEKHLVVSELDAVTGMPIWSRMYSTEPGTDDIGVGSVAIDENNMIQVGLSSVKTDGSSSLLYSIDENGDFNSGYRIIGPGGEDYKYVFGICNLIQSVSGNNILVGSWNENTTGSKGLHLLNFDMQGTNNCNDNEIVLETASIEFNSEAIDPLSIITEMGKIRIKADQVGGLSTHTTNFDGCSDVIPTPPVKTLEISPNPNNGSFKVEFANEIDHGTIRMFNLLGKEVYRVAVEQYAYSQQMAVHVPEGIYFIELVNAFDQRQAIEKIIVR